MDDIFESLPKLFDDKMQKLWMKSQKQIVVQLSKFNVWNKENKKIGLMYDTREYMINSLSCVDFPNLFHVIKYHPQLNQKLVKKTLIPLSSQVQEPFNGEAIIQMNLNYVCLKLIQEYTMTSLFIIWKYVEIVFLQEEKKW